MLLRCMLCDFWSAHFDNFCCLIHEVPRKWSLKTVWLHHHKFPEFMSKALKNPWLRSLSRLFLAATFQGESVDCRWFPWNSLNCSSIPFLFVFFNSSECGAHVSSVWALVCLYLQAFMQKPCLPFSLQFFNSYVLLLFFLNHGIYLIAQQKCWLVTSLGILILSWRQIQIPTSPSRFVFSRILLENVSIPGKQDQKIANLFKSRSPLLAS